MNEKRTLSVAEVFAGIKKRKAEEDEKAAKSVPNKKTSKLIVPIGTTQGVPRVYLEPKPPKPVKVGTVSPEDLPRESLSPRERDKLAAARSTKKTGRS